MKQTFKTSGVCAREINFEVENGKVTEVEFVGGCNGNLKGIGVLCKGMDTNEVIDKLKGLKCGNKETSCPDQLAKALEEVVA